uniref:Uncharacterized protein n=1 Tax=Anguilla anguilla TaxID=7936 RepID=A0A0E9XRW8_ANGAN
MFSNVVELPLQVKIDELFCDDGRCDHRIFNLCILVHSGKHIQCFQAGVHLGYCISHPGADLFF